MTNSTITKRSNTNFKRTLLLGLSSMLLLTAASVGMGARAHALGCERVAPGLTFNTPASQAGNPGDTLQYQLTVTNNDVACASSTFTLSNSTLPTGWQVSHNGTAVDLLPGESVDYSVSVTSPLNAMSGDQAVPVYALQNYNSTDPDAPMAYLLPVDITYTVVNGSTSDTEAPVVSIISPANGAVVAKGSTTTIVASASDNVGVTAIEFYVDGTLVCSGTATTCDWNVPNKRKAHTTIEVRAYDAALNVSTASLQVSVR